jgi:hypothetical protein
MGVCARGVRWFDARNRQLHVVVKGVQHQTPYVACTDVHRGPSVTWLNGNTLKIRGRGLAKDVPSHLLSRGYASSVADRRDSTKPPRAVRHTTPARSAPTVISRADRVRALRWSPVHRLISPKTPTIVKIVRISKMSISVPKMQTCSVSSHVFVRKNGRLGASGDCVSVCGSLVSIDGSFLGYRAFSKTEDSTGCTN